MILSDILIIVVEDEGRGGQLMENVLLRVDGTNVRFISHQSETLQPCSCDALRCLTLFLSVVATKVYRLGACSAVQS